MVKTLLLQELFKISKDEQQKKKTRRHDLEALHLGNEAVKPRSLTRIAFALKNGSAVSLVSKG